MFITPRLMPTYTQAEIDAVVSGLFTTLDDFSNVACADGRMNGVKTECDTCDEEINRCLQQHLIRVLFSTNDFVEKILGYSPVAGYHTETLPYSRYQKFLELSHPYISKLNVTNTVVFRESLSVQPHFFTGDTVLSASLNLVRIAESYIIEDPSTIIFRDANNRRIFPEDRYGFPRTLDGFFEWSFETSYVGLFAYYCNLVLIEIPSDFFASVAVGVVVVPTLMFPNSTQRIPVYMTTGSRIWVRSWNLANPIYNSTDLSAGEFHKLLTSIDVGIWAEVVTLPSVTMSLACDVVVPAEVIHLAASDISIQNAKYGVLSVCDLSSLSTTACTQGVEFVTIFYKTDPSLFVHIDAIKETLDKAVSYFVAANLPITVCKCDIKDGFISTAQKSLSEIRLNPVTGELIQNPKYGDLYGHHVFAESLQQVPQYYKTITL